MNQENFIVDGYGRNKSVSPICKLDARQMFDNLPLLFDESTSGAGARAHSTTEMRTRMTVTSGTDQVVRQSRMRFNCQSGKTLTLGANVLMTSASDVYKKCGLYDGSNGVYFQNLNGALTWNIIKGGVVTQSIAQASWNLDQLLDASLSPSRTVLTIASAQELIFEISGAFGSVRVGFRIRGRVIFVHEFMFANESSVLVPFMTGTSLPVRFDILSAGSASTMDVFDCYVIEDGWNNNTLIPRAIDKGTTAQTIAAGVKSPVMTFRLKSGRQGAPILIKDISIIAGSVSNFRWGISSGATLSATLAYNAVLYSSVEYNTAWTTETVSDEGILLHSGYVKSSLSSLEHPFNEKFLRPGMSISGTMDIWTLWIQNLSASPETYLASLNYEE